MLCSARTNNPLRMPGVKSHSADGRRFRDLMRAYSESLGGLDAIGAADIALVREAVSKTRSDGGFSRTRGGGRRRAGDTYRKHAFQAVAPA